jgi:hypothetical protein
MDSAGSGLPAAKKLAGSPDDVVGLPPQALRVSKRRSWKLVGGGEDTRSQALERRHPEHGRSPASKSADLKMFFG